MKRQKGITLVALVLTVIILLILAGVAISLITGAGLFDRAKDAAGKYNEAATNEAEIINQLLNADYLNTSGNGNNNEQGGDEEQIVMPQIPVDTVATKPSTIDGKKGTAENPIIPEGFKAINAGNAMWGSNDGWNKGLVIQDVKEGSETIGSEFVWVPVKVTINDEIQAKLNNNTPLTVDEIQSIWERKAWTINKGVSTTGTLDKSRFTEPFSGGFNGENTEFIAMATSVLKNGGFYVGRYEGGTETARTEQTDPTSTLVSKAHVYPYNWVVWGKAMDDISKPDTDYYGDAIGSKGAVELCRDMYTGKAGYGIKSSLIYGVQWDSIMEWIAGERNVSNSTEWGNYKNRAYTIKAGMEYCYYDGTAKKYKWTTAENSLEKTTSNQYILKTGEYAETETEGATNSNGAVKNIFDLAGNCDEWTMEANDTDVRVYRGGSYSNTGNTSPASRRYSDYPGDPYSNSGIRCVLYW